MLCNVWPDCNHTPEYVQGVYHETVVSYVGRLFPDNSNVVYSSSGVDSFT